MHRAAVCHELSETQPQFQVSYKRVTNVKPIYNDLNLEINSYIGTGILFYIDLLYSSYFSGNETST